ncbi:unnamed protein product [Pipistrellus nathusii]|uniref:Uncharacterized protein n=1 Tax=Pipistrellus nathusii TaxID=59473 RepID=A0ABP0ALE6_PIPNA
MNFTSFHFTQQQGSSSTLLSPSSLSRENGANLSPPEAACPVGWAFSGSRGLFMSWEHLPFKGQLSPGWCGSVDRISSLELKPVWLSGRASVCGLKGPRFDSGQGHVRWLWAHLQ